MNGSDKFNAVGAGRDGNDGAAEVSRRTELLRAAADSELDEGGEQELAALLEKCPEEAHVIEFERGLRRAVAASAPAAVVPLELEARIRMLAGSAGGAAGAGENASSHRNAPRVVEHPASNRSSWGGRGASPRRLMLWGAGLAAAAAIGLATFLNIGSPPQHGDWAEGPARVQLASFLAEHHRECEIHAERAAREFTVLELDRVPAEFAPLLESRPDLDGLDDAELTFRGAGRCAVPGGGGSIHILLSSGQGTDEELASLFIQQDTGALPVTDGVSYRLQAANPDAATGREIIIWRRDGLLYFLVSGQPAVATAVRLAMQAPEPTQRL